jgi:subtilisin
VSVTKLRLVLAGLLVLIMALSLPGPAMAATPDEGKVLRWIIQVEPGVDSQRLARDYGGSLRHSFPDSIISVDLSEDKFDRLRGDFRVRSMRPAVIFEAIQDTLDWGVDRIDAEKVWGGAEDATDVGSGRNAGDGIKVAIIDTGIDWNHPDLAANYKGGYDFANDDADPMDDNGHGTHVAGIVAASDNNNGVIGVAPKAYLYAVKVLNSSGSGTEDDIAAGIQWCIDNGIQIISMSLGYRYYSLPWWPQPLLVKQACDAAYNSGLLVVAAAGNDGSRSVRDTVGYPARYDSVIAVGATDSSDKRPYWSSTGPAVELAAPGVSINSTYWDDTYATMSGTSMACPMVTGTAALVWRAYPSYTNVQVRERLKNTAKDLDLSKPQPDWQFGFGLVDAEAAAGATPPADTPPTVSVTSPANGSFVSGTINITASASDDKGVSKVDFYIDSTLVATDNVAPYEYSWNTTTASDDSHAIKAVATDTASQTAQHIVTVTVDNTQPVVAVVEPAEGATVSGTITIKASVTETNIDNVKYKIDSGSLASMTYNSPYWQASWDSTSVGNGAHTVTVRATDRAGNLGSDTNSFTVSNQGQPVQTMHVKSLQMNLVQLLGGRIAYATATATVVDAAGNPVQGATVSGHWEVSGTTYTSPGGITNASGQGTFQSRAVLNPPSGTTFTFVIESVTKSGWTYDSSTNGDFNGDGTAGDIANSITVP